MRRPRGHIQQRSPGSFRLRYTLGKDPVTGKRRTATATVRGTRKDAERELTRLLRTTDTGEHVDPSRMTVRQWLDTWLDAVRAEISPKTHERYTEIVQSISSRHWASIRLRSSRLSTSRALTMSGPPGGGETASRWPVTAHAPLHTCYSSSLPLPAPSSNS